MTYALRGACSLAPIPLPAQTAQRTPVGALVALEFHGMPFHDPFHGPSRHAARDRVFFDQPSLGYEPYDARLWRLGQSPVTALTSVDLRREAVSSLPRLLCLSASRRVPCTISCTNLVPASHHLCVGVTETQPLRPELAAVLGGWPLSQLTRGVGDSSCFLLSGSLLYSAPGYRDRPHRAGDGLRPVRRLRPGPCLLTGAPAETPGSNTTSRVRHQASFTCARWPCGHSHA